MGDSADTQQLFSLIGHDAVVLLERLPALFGMDDGRWTLEFVFDGGRLEKAYFHRGMNRDEVRLISRELLERARQAR